MTAPNAKRNTSMNERTEGQSSLKQVLLYCTESSRPFADALYDKLKDHLDIQKGEIIRRNFSGGEAYYRLKIDGRYDLFGKDVIYVTNTASDTDFLELLRVGSSFAGYGARSRIFVIPFFGYSTMERAVHPGEIVTCKSNVRMLSCIPGTGLGNVFMFMDLHVNGILHYFENDCLRVELYAQHALVEGIRRLNLGAPDRFMIASADLGRPKWVQTFSQIFGTGIAFVRKTRSHEDTAIHEVIGSVEGKHVLIYDDMTRSAGTLIQAAEAYIKHGATGVSAALSHCALDSIEVVTKLLASPIQNIIVTNTHPMSQIPEILAHPDRFIVVDASTPFADCITEYLRSISGGCGCPLRALSSCGDAVGPATPSSSPFAHV
eukprot:gnl/Trimastix_PCT/1773.p1 GENE.gnl/Trimastix_PCT/1773~~gnl/Trimastix_PCT/1773.p1  ORF type:complete len:376 (+),score=89.93 gnl/Trimastix_PCT/1773:14-1141(+)